MYHYTDTLCISTLSLSKHQATALTQSNCNRATSFQKNIRKIQCTLHFHSHLYRKCITSLLSTKQNPPTNPSPCSASPTSLYTVWAIVSTKALKSLLLAFDPPRLQGSAHHLRIPSLTRCSSGPQSGRQSPEVRASGSQRRAEEKGKSRSKEQQGSSSESECQR